jgi:peptide deformylase
MKSLKILTHPDPFLSTKAREITPQELLSGTADDVNLLDLVRDMLVTMYLNRGAGLAATQVGIGLRLFVADVSPGNGHPFHVVNPVISEPTGMETDLEGCLSVPGTRVDVQRPKSVLVTGLYIDGRPAMFRANGLMARLCQHETDHLDGVLFIERAQAKLVVIAEDVDPPEVVAHLPLLCDERKIPYLFVPTKEQIGKAIGIDVPAAAACIAKEGEATGLLKEIISRIEQMKRGST